MHLITFNSKGGTLVPEVKLLKLNTACYRHVLQNLMHDFAFQSAGEELHSARQ